MTHIDFTQGLKRKWADLHYATQSILSFYFIINQTKGKVRYLTEYMMIQPQENHQLNTLP